MPIINDTFKIVAAANQTTTINKRKTRAHKKNERKIQPWIDDDNNDTDDDDEDEENSMRITLMPLFCSEMTWNQLKFTAGRMKNSVLCFFFVK